MPGHRYPARRYPAPLDRVGLDHDDLHHALQELDIYLDVSEEDLNRVYRMANMNSYRRKMGEITCAGIMSRDLITAEYNTGLAQAWYLLRYHKIKAIPVIGSKRQVVGIITMVDFLKHTELESYGSIQEKILKCIRSLPERSAQTFQTVNQIMSSPVVTANQSMHIADLVPMLTIRHVPIVDDQLRLVGMITQSDLIAALYAGQAARQQIAGPL